jgi:hypothetical protein
MPESRKRVSKRVKKRQSPRGSARNTMTPAMSVVLAQREELWLFEVNRDAVTA